MKAAEATAPAAIASPPDGPSGGAAGRCFGTVALDQSGNEQVTEAAQRMKNPQQGEVDNMRAILDRIQ